MTCQTSMIQRLMPKSVSAEALISKLSVAVDPQGQGMLRHCHDFGLENTGLRWELFRLGSTQSQRSFSTLEPFGMEETKNRLRWWILR